MAMEKRNFRDLPWQLGQAAVVEACEAEAYRWELVGVWTEAAQWKRAARRVAEADPQWFAQAAALGEDDPGASSDVALVRAEGRAALLRGLIYFRSLNRNPRSA